MIQKKKFSEAIAANISVVEELVGIASGNNDGLLSSALYKNRFQTFSVESNTIYEFSITKGDLGYMLLVKGCTVLASENGLLEVFISNNYSHKIQYNTGFVEIKLSPNKDKIYIQGKVGNRIAIRIDCVLGVLSSWRNIGYNFPDDAIGI